MLQWRDDSGSDEALFGKEVEKMRGVMLETFGHMLPNPRIIKDIGKSGKQAFRTAELWPGGPTWDSLPGLAKPTRPAIETLANRHKTWDVWFTDYSPTFWEHVFGDDPLNEGKDPLDKGKDLCPSPESQRATSVTDLIPHCSWLTYHGTSITSAMAMVSMNTINKGEEVHGAPAKNDTTHPSYGQTGVKSYGDHTYETNAGRGIYTATTWHKAKQYASPFAALERAKVTAQLVLLVRIPGSLADVGMCIQVGSKGKKSFKWQQDLDGNEIELQTNWAYVDLKENVERVIEEYGGRPNDIILREGFCKWMHEKEKGWKSASWEELCNMNKMPLDPTMQKRAVRNEMQREAETSHRGEARWTNMDNYLIECMSSACAIVGFFVGYGVALGKNSTDLCQSRAGQAETTIDFTLLPPLCRPDDVESKNTLLEIKRKKNKEAAGQSSDGAAQSSHEPPDGQSSHEPPGLAYDDADYDPLVDDADDGVDDEDYD